MKDFVKGSSALTALSVGEMFMRFVRTKCIALILGPAGTGFMAQLVIFFETLRIWGDLGARRAVIKQIAEERKTGEISRYQQVISTSYFFALIASLVAGLVVVLFAPQISQLLFGSPAHTAYIMALALILPLASISTVTASIVKGNLDYLPFAKYTLAAYGVVILCTPALIYFLGYWGALISHALFFVFPLIGYLLFNARKKFLYFSKVISFASLKEQFSYGFFQIYNDSLTQISRLIIATWVVKTLGLSAMGVFQVVLTFSMVYISIPMQSMSGYTFPLIASSQTPHEISRAVNESLRFLLFLLVPVIVGVMLFSELFITFFFSGDFLAAGPVLRIQLFGTLFLLFQFSFGASLAAKGKLKAMFFTSTLSPLLMLSGAWFFFDAWGLKGVATAYAIAMMFSMIADYLFNHYYFQLRLPPKNQKLVLATLIWVTMAFVAGQVPGAWVFKSLVFLTGIPWFWLSSKDHERKFILDKLASTFKSVRKYEMGFRKIL